MIFSGGIVFVVRSDAWMDINNEREIRKIVLLYFTNKLSLLVPSIDLADTNLESTDLNNATRMAHAIRAIDSVVAVHGRPLSVSAAVWRQEP
jgi:hypothetical protein